MSYLLKALDNTAKAFKFDIQKTPLASWQEVLAGTLGYLFLVHYGLPYLVTRFKLQLKEKLKFLFGIHNGLLSFCSAVLLVLMLGELDTMRKKSTMWDVYCDEKAQFVGEPIYFYYYINYLFKWYELLDTMFMVLRGTSPPFLHWYHHAATLVLCWTQMSTESCMQWVPICINLCIHVVMYAYYAGVSFGVDMNWLKRNLTTMQIIQFVVGLCACIYPLYLRLSNDLPPLFGFESWNKPYCHGTYVGAAIGILILSTYLLEFSKLFTQKYKKNVLRYIINLLCFSNSISTKNKTT